MNVKSYRSLTSSDIKVEKGLGAVILFILTFVLTLIPYKLKSIQEINLRTVKCFCGGVSWILFFKFHTSKNLRASILFWETRSAFLKISLHFKEQQMNYFGLRNFLLSFILASFGGVLLVNICLCQVNSKTLEKIRSMFKVNNKKTRMTSAWRRPGVFIVNFEHVSHLFLVFLVLTWNK